MRNIFESLSLRGRREARTQKPDAQQIISRAASNYFVSREKEYLLLGEKMRKIRTEGNFPDPLSLAKARNTTDKSEQEYRLEADRAVAEFDQEQYFLLARQFGIQ